MSKKLRVFAGPNGSGKTTLINRIRDHYHYNVGIFVNSDQIEASLKNDGNLHFSAFKIEVSEIELVAFFTSSTWLSRAGWGMRECFKVDRNVFYIVDRIYLNSYLAAALSDFIRTKLLELNLTFSTETVMSDVSKLELIKDAKRVGYKVYLYYITTDDVRINILRVKTRAKSGGHDVPLDKIKSRYYRSLDLLYDAVKCCNKAFLIDTSGDLKLVSEVTDGNVCIKQQVLPNWYISYIEEKVVKLRDGEN